MLELSPASTQRQREHEPIGEALRGRTEPCGRCQALQQVKNSTHSNHDATACCQERAVYHPHEAVSRGQQCATHRVQPIHRLCLSLGQMAEQMRQTVLAVQGLCGQGRAASAAGGRAARQKCTKAHGDGAIPSYPIQINGMCCIWPAFDAVQSCVLGQRGA